MLGFQPMVCITFGAVFYLYELLKFPGVQFLVLGAVALCALMLGAVALAWWIIHLSGDP